jgi:HEPN domain-containing protein
MKEPNREAGRWLRQAEYDLRSARHSSEGDFHAAACFQAQQAVEKALKAYLYAQGERLVLGHSVAELCARCARVDERFSALARDVAVLDRFYIPTRYPNGLPGGIPAEAYLAEDSHRALSLAEQAITFVAQRLRIVEDQ